jgi:predicted N-acyltransferase
MIRAGTQTAAADSAVRDVRVQQHIEEVDPAEWDSVLGPDDVQLSHRFIRACQRADVEGAEYRFVLIEDGQGLACVATLCCLDVRLELLTSRSLRRSVARVRQLYNDFLRVRVLFCGLPVSFGRPCIRFRHDADRVRCIAVLEDVIGQTALELDASIVCWKEFDRCEVEELESLESLGYIWAASLPSCRLAMRWSSFEEYVCDMRSGYRRQVRQAQRVAHRAGLTFRSVAEFGPWCAEIDSLYHQVMDRAEFQLERLNLAFFEELNLAFPVETSAILAERNGAVAAAAIVLDSPNTCAFLLAGIDYARNRETGAYVSLVAEVIAHAIRRGAAVLEMGQTSYDIKRRLGGRAEPRSLFLRHQSRAAHAFLRWTRGVMFPSRTYSARHVFREVGASEAASAECGRWHRRDK